MKIFSVLSTFLQTTSQRWDSSKIAYLFIILLDIFKETESLKSYFHSNGVSNHGTESSSAGAFLLRCAVIDVFRSSARSLALTRVWVRQRRRIHRSRYSGEDMSAFYVQLEMCYYPV